MQQENAVDLCSAAILITLLISSPVLAAGLVVGLVLGLLPALPQIQEQSITFVPKLVAMVLTLSLTLPWVITQLLEYTQTLIGNMPQNL